MKLRRFLLVIAAALIPTVPPHHAAAQQADVIRGRVTGPDSAALEGVAITVTSISGNVSRTAKTDRNGRFTVTFPSGDGDYMVAFAALGYAAKRFEVNRAADEDILVADARLVSRRRDSRPCQSHCRATKSESQRAGASGYRRNGNSSHEFRGARESDGRPRGDGRFASRRAVGSRAGWRSRRLFGARTGADQNNTTLNGMQFGGSSLPRDACVSSSVITSPYDVSRGGFSGAQLSIRTRSGSNFLTRGMSLNVDAPQLQWTDRAGTIARAGIHERLAGRHVSAARSSSTRRSTIFRTSSDVARTICRRCSTPMRVDSTAVGVSADSVSDFSSILNNARVPLTVGVARRRPHRRQRLAVRQPRLRTAIVDTGQALNVSFNGNWGKQNPTSGFATELPAHSGERTELARRRSGATQHVLRSRHPERDVAASARRNDGCESVSAHAHRPRAREFRSRRRHERCAESDLRRQSDSSTARRPRTQLGAQSAVVVQRRTTSIA